MRSVILDAVVIALGVLCLVSCADRPQPVACAVDVDHMRQVAVEQDHARFAQVPDATVATFMKRLNDMEPPTDFIAAHVYVAQKPLAPALIMLFDENNCFTDLVGVTPDDFTALMR